MEVLRAGVGGRYLIQRLRRRASRPFVQEAGDGTSDASSVVVKTEMYMLP